MRCSGLLELRPTRSHARPFGQAFKTSISRAQSFDFILSTVSGDLPWDEYLAALRPQGKLVVVGVPNKPISINGFSLLAAEKTVSGGVPCSPVETAQMLAFTARHAIKPMVELVPMAEVNRALDHTRSGKARYRTVLAA